MVTLVDTSAFYAFLDASDANHRAALALMRRLLEGREDLVTHSYVVVETCALVQRRLGADAVRSFIDDILPIVRVVWIDEGLHRQATASLLGSLGRSISLVDWTSFTVMRERGITRAFAFDADFEAQGFRLLADPPTTEAVSER